MTLDSVLPLSLNESCYPDSGSGTAQHVTLRGEHRADVFETDDDRHAHLRHLKKYTAKHAPDLSVPRDLTLQVFQVELVEDHCLADGRRRPRARLRDVEFDPK